MNEQEIQTRLKQNIPQIEDTTPVAPAPVVDTSYGQATVAPEYELDETTQYKLHDFFGVQYRPTDEISRQQVQYIYEKVSKMVEEQDYGYVVAKIRDLERIIGTQNSQQRIYKLYQWLKLDSMRRNIEAEMGAISYA